MNDVNFHIETNGYILSPQDEDCVKGALAFLSNATPQQYHLNVLLCRSGHAFEGLFNLNSSSVRIEVFQKAQSFKQTFSTAILKLNKQLRKEKVKQAAAA